MKQTNHLLNLAKMLEESGDLDYASDNPNNGIIFKFKDGSSIEVIARP